MIVRRTGGPSFHSRLTEGAPPFAVFEGWDKVKNQLTGFGYDAAGNMTSNGSATYTYDAENRITSSAGCTFTYDGDGSRVQKTGCGSIVYWRKLGGDTLEEASTSGTMLREYVFFNGQRIARRDVSTNNVFYFFDDHLGSTSLVTNSAGAMPPQMESDYYPYGGEIAITTGIQDQNYKFTGKERDSATGLDYFGARYYASTVGRFMIPDWAVKPTDVPYANFGKPRPQRALMRYQTRMLKAYRGQRM